MSPLRPASAALGLLLPLLAGGAANSAEEATYHGLICRGVEESGRLFIGQPGFGPHLVSLFVTGPNPLSASQTLPDHVAWVNDPRHSYVADGTGGLVIWAHPSLRDAQNILGLPGLAGLEVQHAGAATMRDQLWDEVLRGCVAAQRPFLWGYAADDTHSRERIGYSWYAARVPRRDEAALKAALRAGALYVSGGPVISDIQAEGNAISLRLGQEAEVLWLRAGQYLSTPPQAEVAVTLEPGENHCLRWDRAVQASTLKLDELHLSPQQLQFVRAVVRTAPDKVAHTQPWRLAADGSIENPYPPAGEWVRGQTHNHTDTGPGRASGLPQYRLAYQAIGELASFATDYSYWESPYQWLPSDGTPQIETVTPDRCQEGEEVELLIKGVNLDPKGTVQLDDRALKVRSGSAEELRVVVPSSAPAGLHDLVVTNPDRFRDCLAQGFTVQNRGADNTGWQSFTVRDGLAYPHSTCVACFGDQVWLGSVFGVSQYQGGKWTVFRGELPGASAYGMVADPQGGVWISGGSGVGFCSPAGEWLREQVGQTEALPRGRASERWGRLAFDRSGQLWVTNRWSAGLAVRRDGQWQRLTSRDGLPSDSTSAVACDSGGTVWVGFGGGLYRLVDKKWAPVALPEALQGCRYVSALVPGPEGTMWGAVTAEGNAALGGAVHWVGGEATAFTPSNSPLPSARVRDVLVAKQGDVWFATDVGAARLRQDGEWQVFTSVNSGLGCNTVLGLAEDPQGRIWLATSLGASCLTPSK